MAMAASTLSQLRSAIFFSAISRIWSRVTLPAVSPLPGVLPKPFLPIFGGLLEEERNRRLLHLEGEGAVLIGGDDHRDRGALFDLRGLRVEGLAEFHDVEAALTERGADRRRRVGRAGRDLELDVARDFLCHGTALQWTSRPAPTGGMVIAGRGAAWNSRLASGRTSRG